MVIAFSSFALGLVLAATTALAGMRYAEYRHEQAEAEVAHLEQVAARAGHYAEVVMAARCQAWVDLHAQAPAPNQWRVVPVELLRF